MLLSGTGEGEAATTLLALARVAGQPTVVLGQQRVVGGIAHCLAELVTLDTPTVSVLLGQSGARR